jgi:hypothetical protein
VLKKKQVQAGTSLQEEEMMITEKEEEMKTENMEGNESNKNVSSMSSGASGGEISGASPQKRTSNNA